MVHGMQKSILILMCFCRASISLPIVFLLFFCECLLNVLERYFPFHSRTALPLLLLVLLLSPACLQQFLHLSDLHFCQAWRSSKPGRPSPAPLLCPSAAPADLSSTIFPETFAKFMLEKSIFDPPAKISVVMAGKQVMLKGAFIMAPQSCPPTAC